MPLLLLQPAGPLGWRVGGNLLDLGLHGREQVPGLVDLGIADPEIACDLLQHLLGLFAPKLDFGGAGLAVEQLMPPLPCLAHVDQQLQPPVGDEQFLLDLLAGQPPRLGFLGEDFAGSGVSGLVQPAESVLPAVFGPTLAQVGAMDHCCRLGLLLRDFSQPLGKLFLAEADRLLDQGDFFVNEIDPFLNQR